MDWANVALSCGSAESSATERENEVVSIIMIIVHALSSAGVYRTMKLWDKSECFPQVKAKDFDSLSLKGK